MLPPLTKQYCYERLFLQTHRQTADDWPTSHCACCDSWHPHGRKIYRSGFFDAPQAHFHCLCHRFGIRWTCLYFLKLVGTVAGCGLCAGDCVATSTARPLEPLFFLFVSGRPIGTATVRALAQTAQENRTCPKNHPFCTR